MLPDDDPRHGSTRGYHAGCDCIPCRAAIARYQKGIRYNRLTGRRLSVPAIGAQRRIQALMALGWTGHDIAEETGWAHRNHVRRILVGQKGKPCTWVEQRTHDAIAECFERLAMRLPTEAPHRARCRTMARKRGWVPPLAWDDIDDPNERPGRSLKNYGRHDIDPVVIERIISGEGDLHTTVAEKHEAMRRWKAMGRSERSLCELTGWKESRYGRDEVADAC